MSRALLLVVIGVACAVAGCAATRQESAIEPVTPPVTVTFDNRPALEVVEFLATHYQRGVRIDHSAMTEIAKPVSVAFDRAPWERVRDVMAESHDLDLSLRDGFLSVDLAHHAGRTGRMVMRSYRIDSITRAMSSYEALPLDLTRTVTGEASPHLEPLQPDIYPEINEFIEVIQREARPDSWAWEGVSIEDWNGQMVVTHTPEVHAALRTVLAHQEAMVWRQCVCRLYRLPQVPAGTRPVLSAAEWSSMTAGMKPELPPPAAVFLATNDQHQRHFAGIQRLLTLDADQNQNQQEPVTHLVSTGLSLSFRPTIMVDGVRVAARLWATVDATYPTQVIANGAGQPLVTITTPRISTDTADDLREIPFGGAAIYRFGERAYALTVEIVDLPALKR